jgi:RNA polymerase sigma-70 factor (ECF subfamily)
LSQFSDELFKRIADGDRLAMRTLFARHCVPIYRLLLRIVGDAAVAEDLLSEVFLDLWRKAEYFEGRSCQRRRKIAISRPQ